MALGGSASQSHQCGHQQQHINTSSGYSIDHRHLHGLQWLTCAKDISIGPGQMTNIEPHKTLSRSWMQTADITMALGGNTGHSHQYVPFPEASNLRSSPRMQPVAQTIYIYMELWFYHSLGQQYGLPTPTRPLVVFISSQSQGDPSHANPTRQWHVSSFAFLHNVYDSLCSSIFPTSQITCSFIVAVPTRKGRSGWLHHFCFVFFIYCKLNILKEANILFSIKRESGIQRL